jgi:hypothetical protein
MWRAGVVCLVVILAGIPMAAGQAIRSCGDGFELFMRNPDMVPGTDDKYHVSGDSFVQFQVIGEDADDIEIFTMSVGLPPSNPQEFCTLPAWPSGLMLESYKADMDKTDGFFILLNTKGQSTPQNTDLQVSVHGYDADGNELARFWGLGRVESCPAQTGGCPANEAMDKQMPWPIILPGDGQKDYVDGQGFTIEFPEAIANFSVHLNGVNVTVDMEDWEGRLWDADTFYDYGPAGIFAQAAPMCTQPAPLQTCVTSPGPAYKWTERPIEDVDIIRVVATDMFGNVAKKEIHVGSSVAGGTIADGLPLLAMTFDETQVLSNPGQTARFQARLENTGGGTGHPLVSAVVPEEWTYDWFPGHKPVEPATQETQELNIHIPAGTPAGIYAVTAVMEYQKGQADQRFESALEVLVGGDIVATNDTTNPKDGGDKESPAPLFIIAPLVAALVLRRRR